ncbi:unnamed protein product [Lampetra fluviatilis]
MHRTATSVYQSHEASGLTLVVLTGVGTTNPDCCSQMNLHKPRPFGRHPADTRGVPKQKRTKFAMCEEGMNEEPRWVFLIRTRIPHAAPVNPQSATNSRTSSPQTAAAGGEAPPSCGCPSTVDRNVPRATIPPSLPRRVALLATGRAALADPAARRKLALFARPP